MTRIPPHDLEAERSVLGAMLIDADAAAKAMQMLSADSWHHPGHGQIFAAMLLLTEQSEPIDEVTVRSQLTELGALERVGGTAHLMQLSGHVPTAANVGHYARIVEGHARRRRLIAHGSATTAAAFDLSRSVGEIEDEAASHLMAANDDKARGPRSACDLALAEDVAEREREAGNAQIGLSTGFRDLDLKIDGLDDGALIVLGARPSMGKTALALNIAAHVMMHEKAPTLIMSYEMSGDALWRRLICAEGKIDGSRLRRGTLDEAGMIRRGRAQAALGVAPLAIDDTCPNIAGIRTTARRHKLRHGLGLLLVDYLQLVPGSGQGDGRERDIAEISRGLKSLATELQIPILALSQLNRGVESRPEKRPMLSDLRESGAIEQDADVVLFLYRDFYYDSKADPGAAEVNVAKSRGGPTGVVKLTWADRYCRFEDATF